MAVDTANKRFSIVHFGCPWRGILPIPDGSLDAGDRIELEYLYRGFFDVWAVTQLYQRRIGGRHPHGLDDWSVSYQA